MKRSLLIVGLAASVALNIPAYAEKPSTVLHPVLGKTPPRELLNKDILALPQREQAAWVHGNLSQMIQVYARVDPMTSKCLSDWAFDVGEGAEAIPAFMRHYPDQIASVTILAVANQACEGI